MRQTSAGAALGSRPLTIPCLAGGLLPLASRPRPVIVSGDTLMAKKTKSIPSRFLPVWPFCLSLLPALLIGGCGGAGEPATTVRRPAGQRPDIEAQAIPGALAVPASEAFNIVSFKSGQEGNARGESKPMGLDGAVCRAEASEGGTAWGEFQLGYCFDNASGKPLRAAVKLRLNVAVSQQDGAATLSPQLADVERQPVQAATTAAEHPAAAPSPDSPSPGGQGNSATTTLKYFVKDTNGVLLRQETLAAIDLERGPQTAKGEPMRIFEVQLPPERGCYLMIAGRTDVRAGPAENVAALLEVQQCSLDIAWQPQSPEPLQAQPVTPQPGQ